MVRTGEEKTSGPPARGASADWLITSIVVLAVLAVTLFDPRVFNDGDTYWHITACRWMLDHGQVLRTDIFSFTATGAPWVAHEWLAELLMAIFYRADSWSGVAVLYGLAVATMAALLAQRIGRSLSGVALLLTLILTLTCVASSLLARPHILALPLLVAWTATVLAARDAGRAPKPLAALLIVLWANIHGSYVFAFIILGAFALEALIETDSNHRLRVVRDWGLFGALSVAAAVVTPHGL